ncbi:hypothetical protein PIB30_053529, partial [Stylosanthes scabra]|nr:hypothetical protein [Stylosanthes scabra]
MRGRARICVGIHAYACYIVKSILCMHRRRRPRICVAYVWTTLAASNSTRPRICVVESVIHAYAWEAASSHVTESRLAHSKRELSKGSPSLASTHMRTFLRICVGLSSIGHRPTPHTYNYADQHPTHFN